MATLGAERLLKTPRAPEPSELAGMRVALGVLELAEVAQLRSRVQELEASVVIAADAKIVCPVVVATPGMTFTHHTDDANRGDLELDHFDYVGRTTGNAHTPAGWLIFRHLGLGRGICANGSHGGLNGGMRDAIGAWPMSKYYNYEPNGSIPNENEIALPLRMCWAFRPADDEDDEDDYDEDNHDEDNHDEDEEDKDHDEDDEDNGREEFGSASTDFCSAVALWRRVETPK